MPLIIKGARQIGKTESIKRFAYENYPNVIYINFVEEPKYKSIIEDGYGTDEIIRNISRIDPGKHFVEKDTLLIFDELQEFPEIATSLKFFRIDGRFDVICSGSLLGIHYRRIESNSVGYKMDYEMYSMDFEEFLWAKGYDETAISDILTHMHELKPFNDKKFQISKVASGARFKDYRGCIEWLADAGLINVCYCLHMPELPIKGNYNDSKYKLYFKDSGLLVAMLDEESQEDLRVNKNLGVYKGALYENIVGEALAKSGYELYYYKREDSTLEEDFFVRSRNDLVPVEVKATNGRAKSLRTLISSKKYEEISYGVKLCHGNVGFENQIYSFPYFCSFLLKRFLKERS